MNQTAEQEVMIAPPHVEPYSPANFLSCRACGLRIGRWDRFRIWFKGGVGSIINAKYCAGGKLPTENRGMMAAIMSGEVEAFNPCAGITEPHLHTNCNRCGFLVLMATAQPIRRVN